MEQKSARKTKKRQQKVDEYILKQAAIDLLWNVKRDVMMLDSDSAAKGVIASIRAIENMPSVMR